MNNTLSLSGFLIILVSFVLALLLSILPLPVWMQIFYPQWLPLILIYWVVALPERIGLLTAWILGLLLDALYGSVLGTHALAMTVVAYLAQKFYRQIRMFPVFQQTLCIFVFILFYQMLLLWIQGMLTGHLGDAWWFWASAVVSMLLWPWLGKVLRASRNRIY